MSTQTSNENLQFLKSNPAIVRMRGKRLGLVLAGGGAKGAYQAGCLHVLHNLGLHQFEVIAGTSVGALNAAGVAAEKIPEIVDLWKGISFARVFRPSLRLFYLMLGELVALFLKKQGSYLNRGIELVLLVISHFILGVSWLIVIPISVLLSIPFKRLWWAISGLGEILRCRVEEGASIAEQSTLRDALEKILFPNHEERLKNGCPAFVTATADAYWFDPDFPSFESRTSGAFDVGYDPTRPTLRHGYLPRYFNLREIPRVTILDTLLQSAALPLAFRRRTLDGVACFDGGLVDNVPLNIALQHPCDLIFVVYLNSDTDPDTYLEQIPRLRRALKLAASDLDALHRLYLDWLKRFAERVSHKPESPWERYFRDIGAKEWRYFDDFDLPMTERFEIVQTEELKDLPSIIHVIPSRNLGGLLRGTLNFRRAKAKWLLELGEHDTLRVLKQYVSADAQYHLPSR